MHCVPFYFCVVLFKKKKHEVEGCNKSKYTLLKKPSLPLQTLLSLSKLALLASDENNGADLEGKLA